MNFSSSLTKTFAFVSVLSLGIASISTLSSAFSISPLSLISPVSVQAQSNSNSTTGIGIVPANQQSQTGLDRAWFLNTVQSGQKVTRTAEIINDFDREATINLFAKDATQTLDGSFTFIENDQPNTEVGSWISLSKTQVTLPAKSSTQVEFTITVPSNTQSGEYAGAIAVQESTNPNADQQGVQLQTRIGARVYLTVGSNLASGFEVKNFNAMTPDASKYSTYIQATKHIASEKMYANFDIQNTGNIYSYAKGKIIIEGPDGKTEVPVNKDLAPRSNAVNLLIDLQRNWVVGDYKITFELAASPVIDGNKSSIAKSESKTTAIQATMTQALLDQMKADKGTGTGTPTAQAKTGTGFSVGKAAETTTEASSSNTLVYGLIGVIVLLAVGFAGYVIYNKAKKSDSSEKKETKKVN